MENGEKHRSSFFYYMTAIVLIIVSVVLIIIYLLRGETSFTSDNSDVETILYLTCDANNIQYPFFVDNTAKNRTIKINTTFSESGLSTISLIYRQEYSSNVLAEKDIVSEHIAMNEQFGRDSLKADSLGATYSVLDNIVQLGLYANSREINSTTARYFMLDGLMGVYNRDAVAELYNSKGFDCLINN